jgi:hypothetical protein
MSLSPPSTFLCVAGSCTVVDKNAHTIGAIQKVRKNYFFLVKRQLYFGVDNKFYAFFFAQWMEFG